MVTFEQNLKEVRDEQCGWWAGRGDGEAHVAAEGKKEERPREGVSQDHVSLCEAFHFYSE